MFRYTKSNLRLPNSEIGNKFDHLSYYNAILELAWNSAIDASVSNLDIKQNQGHSTVFIKISNINPIFSDLLSARGIGSRTKDENSWRISISEFLPFRFEGALLAGSDAFVDVLHSHKINAKTEVTKQ